MSSPATPHRRYHLALRELHQAAGATFTEFGEWSLPAQFVGMEAEHAALRSNVVLFDRSHRSRFMVTGTDAGEVLAGTFAGHVNELEEGRAMRTVALDERGEIRDLVLIARTGGISYLVTGEPGQRTETLERLRDHRGVDFDVRIEDRTESTCLIGLAGPGAAATARAHLAEGLPARLQSLHCVTFEFHGFRALAVRTSDTGEDGFEFMLAPAVGQHIISALGEAGVPLAGQSAVDAARVEACVPAFAPDLQTGLSPAEADIDVLLEIPGGRERWMLSALLIDSVVALAVGTSAFSAGARIGELRSSARSPALNATIGLAVLESRFALPGAAVDLGGVRATIVAKPIYRRRPSQ